MNYRLKQVQNRGLMTRFLLLACALFGFAVGMQANVQSSLTADLSDVPAVTGYSPSSTEEVRGELKATTSYFIYFESGSNVKSAVCELIQNDKVCGTLNFKQALPSNNVVRLNSKDMPDLAKMNLEAGLVKMRIKTVTYIAKGTTEEKVYEAEGDEVGYVIYKYLGVAPGIASETNFAGNHILSYYPKGSADAVKTITFSAPIVADGIKVELEYGYERQNNILSVSHSLSSDGKTLSIDLSGVLRNVESMPNHDFRDENGNTIAPPTRISLEINGLVTVDGRLVETVSKDGNNSWLLSGRAHYIYDYVDITFETPHLSLAQFYDSANPKIKSNTITASTDMMDLTVANISAIASAGITFQADGNDIAKVAPADVTIKGSVMTVALPQAVKQAGSGSLSIWLSDVRFVHEDGAEHIIKPLDLSGIVSVKELKSIAELKASADGAQVIMNVENVKVTMSNEMGYMFIEDATGAVQVMLSDNSLLTEGKALRGTIVGKYEGGGMFTMDKAKSNYTESDVDVTTGATIAIEDVNKSENMYRLVTFTASNDLPIASDEESNAIIIGNSINTINDFLGDFTVPQEIESVTGIIYSFAQDEVPGLILRHESDVVEKKTTPVDPPVVVIKEVNTIAELKAVEVGEEPVEVKFNVNGVKVTYANNENGIAFLEDATGAIQVGGNVELSQGTALTGYLGINSYGAMGVDLIAEKSEFTTSTVDVTIGAELTLEQAMQTESLGRLVTFTNANSTIEIDETPNMYWIDGKLIAVDFFDVLPWTYEFPTRVESITGILVSDMLSGNVMLSVRSAEDIVEDKTPIIIPVKEVSTISELKAVEVGDEPVEVKFNVNGVKITYANNENGIAFLEDATGAIQVGGDVELTQGTALTGHLGINSYGAMGVDLIAEKSEFTTSTVDVTTGSALTLELAMQPENLCRLVTFTNASSTIEIDETPNMYWIDGKLMAVDFFDVLSWTYEFPTRVESITGILVSDMLSGNVMLSVRSAEDIVEDKTPVIIPVKEVSTISELKVVEVGDEPVEVKFNVNGVKVTYANNENGIAFLEDATGAIQVGGDVELAQGTSLTGYLGINSYGAMGVDLIAEKSEFTTSTVDVTTGAELTLEQTMLSENLGRLVTFTNANSTIEIDETPNMYWIDGKLMAVDFFDVLPWTYEFPTRVESITGILISDMLSGNVMLSVRSAEDIVEDKTPVIVPVKEVNTIAELKAIEVGVAPVEARLNTEGVKVTFSKKALGTWYAFLEDETGAVGVNGNILLIQGYALTGSLAVTVSADGFVLEKDKSQYTTTLVSVSNGAQLTVDEALLPENAGRLVTFNSTNSDIVLDKMTSERYLIDEQLIAYDAFDVLSSGNEYPEHVKSITGIIYNDPRMGGVVLAVRSKSDIVEEILTGINGISANVTAEGNTYSANGTLVRKSGDSLNGLAKGVYIVNGKKIVIK